MRHPAQNLTLVTTLLALSTPACNKAPDATPAQTPTAPSTATTTVATIDSIHCAINQSNPPQLVVTAYGTAPTGGWSGEQLTPRVYATVPADGIWDYDFTASPPSGMATQVLTPTSAEHTWPDYPVTTLLGVRVHGLDAGIKERTLQTCNNPR